MTGVLSREQLGHLCHFDMMVLEDSRKVRPNEAPSPWVDAWCGALMNMWNRDFVHANYPKQHKDFYRCGPEGTVSVAPQPTRHVMGNELITDSCDFGWCAAWASEMGDEPALLDVDRDVEVSRAEVVDGRLLTRLRRAANLSGDGTVSIGRVVGRGRWRLTADGIELGTIDGARAEGDVRIVEDRVALATSAAAREFVLEPVR